MAERSDPPRRASPRRPRIWLTLLGAILLASIVAALAVGYLVVLYPDERGPRSGTVALEVNAGARIRDLAEQLGREGALPRPRVFELYARVLGADRRLKHGRILVTREMTARELLQRIASGYGFARVRITIPEGWNRFEIAKRLAEWGVCERDAFLAAADDPQLLGGIDARARSAEGFFFPDTYWLFERTGARAVVERMLENQRDRWAKLRNEEAEGLTRLRATFGFGLYEVVTLASIVEKEAQVPSEQPLIAGVFLNRLQDPTFQPKRLQADPTVAFGCLLSPALPSCAGFDGKRVTRAMTRDPDNPYNTYRLEGLPPGPIANPGLSALRAVLRPAVHGYYYFVAQGDGRHAFTATLKAHSEAVQRAGMANSSTKTEQ